MQWYGIRRRAAAHGNCGIHSLLGTAEEAETNGQYWTAQARPFLIQSFAEARAADGNAWLRVRAVLLQELVHLFHVQVAQEGSDIEKASARLIFKHVPDATDLLQSYVDAGAADLGAQHALSQSCCEAVLHDDLLKERVKI